MTDIKKPIGGGGLEEEKDWQFLFEHINLIQ